MWTNENYGSGSIMGVLFIIIVIWAIFGGGFGAGRDGHGDYPRATETYSKQVCDAEKQAMIDNHNTQALIQSEAAATRSQATNLYIQDQAEKMFDLKMDAQTQLILQGQTLAAKDAEIAVLKERGYTDARFNALERGQERISCETPKRPEYYAQGFINCGQPIPAGTGYGFGGCNS